MKIQNAVRIFCASISLAFSPAMPAQVLEPNVHHDRGDGITGVFEGWFRNADGSFSALVGYYNRNLKESLDIPVGPNNRMEPGGPDFGQPTHFQTGRMWGNFVVKVPKEFGTANKLNWTLIVNGKKSVIPLNLKTDWELSPLKDADDNTPPMLSFSTFAEKAPSAQGPVPVTAKYEAMVGTPLKITAYVADDDVVSPATRRPKMPVSVHWTVFRTPENGHATFSETRPQVEKTNDTLLPGMKFVGKASTTVSFDQPGSYTLEITANDATGDGGSAFQCCWTNGLVNVRVTAPASTSASPGGTF